MRWIRSLLFNLALILWILCVGVLGLPFIFSRPAVCWIADHWAAMVLRMLSFLCGITYRVTGEPPVKDSVVYAVKHQSAWETIALWLILQRPVFILKKELLSIPVFGWFLARVPHIAIDRKAGRKAMRYIIEQAQMHLKEGRRIVIFPEGTRTEPGDTRPYKQGVASLYEQLHATVIPVALNSGLFWRRNAFLKREGEITVRFLPAIQSGMPRDLFLQTLQETIERESRALLPREGTS